MTTINFTAEVEEQTQVEAIKAVLKALKIKFEMSKPVEKIYNKEFIEKMKRSDADVKAGRVRTVTLDEIWK